MSSWGIHNFQFALAPGSPAADTPAAMSYRVIAASLLIFLHALSLAQTPPPRADRLPPPGLSIAEADRTRLAAGAGALRNEIDALARDLADKSSLVALLPDVEIFHKAVDWALRYDEFFDLKQVAFANTLLEQGRERAKQLRAGQTPWLQSTGLVVRGYHSKLDGSVQPY